MKSFIYSAVFVLSVLCVSCDSISQSSVIGDWQVSEINGAAPKTVSCYTFNEDGTARFYYLHEGLNQMNIKEGKSLGTWKLEDNHFIVNQNNMKTVMYKLKVIDDKTLFLVSRGSYRVKTKLTKRN